MSNRVAFKAFTGGVTYEPETLALIARFTTPATDGLKTAINNAIIDLKAGGYWAVAEHIHKFNMLAIDQCLWDWAGNWNPSLVGTPVFTAKQGITSNAGGYISSNFPLNAGSQYVRDSATWFNGKYNIVSIGNDADGYFDNVALYGVHMQITGTYHRFNSLGSNPTAYPMQNGYNILRRVDNSNYHFYNGIWQTVTVNSVALNGGIPCMGIVMDETGVGFWANTSTHHTDAKFAGLSEADCDAIRVIFETFDAAVAAL